MKKKKADEPKEKKAMEFLSSDAELQAAISSLDNPESLKLLNDNIELARKHQKNLLASYRFSWEVDSHRRHILDQLGAPINLGIQVLSAEQRFDEWVTQQKQKENREETIYISLKMICFISVIFISIVALFLKAVMYYVR